MDRNHVVNQGIDQFSEYNKPLYLAFIDNEKKYYTQQRYQQL